MKRRALNICACLFVAVLIAYGCGNDIFDLQSVDHDAPKMAVSPAPITSFKVDAANRRFLINNQPVYLIGMSYFAATCIPDEDAQEWQEDIDWMIANGFNWIRVWAFWLSPPENAVDTLVDHENVSVIKFSGTTFPRTAGAEDTYMSRLKNIVAYCCTKGMIVEVTLFRAWQETALDFYGPIKPEEHEGSAALLAAHLQDYPNVYFDIANEANENKSSVSYDDMDDVVQRIKGVDPDRLCTASFIDRRDNADPDLAELKVHGLDFLSLHYAHQNSVKHIVYYINKMEDDPNLNMPIHVNETARQGKNVSYILMATHYCEGCAGVKGSGGAGWIFHNGWEDRRIPYRCYNMYNGEKPDEVYNLKSQLYDYRNLDAKEEWEAIPRVAASASGAKWKVRRYQAEYVEQCAPDPLHPRVGALSADGYAWTADTEGYITGGPYDDEPGNDDYYLDDVPAGWSTALWRLKVTGSGAPDDPVLTLSVYCESQQEDLNSMDIYWDNFNAPDVWQKFALPFNSSGQKDLRLRAYYTGNAAGVSCDWVELNMITPEPTITVASPGDTVYIGETIKIAWETSGISGNVKIEGKKNDVKGIVIEERIPYDDSPYYYVIPDVPEGSYFIRVSQGEIKGDSPSFYVKMP